MRYKKRKGRRTMRYKKKRNYVDNIKNTRDQLN